MRGVAEPALRDQARQLRLIERLSIKEIHNRIGVSVGTLSGWLRDIPLTKEEIRARQSDPATGRFRAPKKDRGAESTIKHLLRGELTISRKARLAESAVLLRLVLAGYNAYNSPFDGDKTDWLVEVPGRPHPVRLQVKWASDGTHGLPCVRLTCADGRHAYRRYLPPEFDFIAGYDFHTDIVYVWSREEVADLLVSVTVCPEAAERWDKMLVGP